LIRTALDGTKTSGANDASVAITLNVLGVLYTLQGWYRSAELLYRREMAIYATSFGPRDPHMAGNRSSQSRSDPGRVCGTVATDAT
jgi:hypothetical protein